MLQRAQQIQDQLIHWRRQIHKHPELGFQETRTAALVAQELESLGYRVRTGVGRTGVVGEWGEGHPIVAIRADMDALPIDEANEVPYASQVPGVMHACGHDAHTAIALGVATLLAKETFSGTVRFLFQPSEEMSDEEGYSGAARMIQDGAMEGVDAALALHVNADKETGDVALGAGPVSAGVDTLYATIVGQGGHGAAPHKLVDATYITGHVILALHGITARRIDPFDPAVISIGSIRGGQVENVIPERMDIIATIRYMDPKVQKTLHTEVERVLGIAQALGGDYECKIEIGYPPMFNDEGITSLLRQVATELLGAEHVKVPDKHLGAEDFGFFSSLAPGAMFSLGCRLEGDGRKAHSPTFDIDERCLPIGAAILAAAALRLLNRGSVGG